MKKAFISIQIASLLMMSCSVNDRNDDYKAESGFTCVRMTVEPFAPEDDVTSTKNVVIRETSGANYVWSETDTVGIFPDIGSQIYFSMAAGAGQASASFDGGGWALKDGSGYYAYFPFVPDFRIDKEAIPFDYRGQVQNGNKTATNAEVNIGNYCFMVAKGNAAEGGTLYFDYEKIGALLIASVPVDAGEYEYATLRMSDKVIPYKGTFNAITVDKKMYNTTLSDTLSIGFRNMQFGQKGVLTFYMMFPPFPYMNKQFSIVTVKKDGTALFSSFAGSDFAINKVYPRPQNLSVSPASVGMTNSGGSFSMKIITSSSTSYAVSKDADWIKLGSSPTSGDATITVTVSSGSGDRVGHIIVSEVVDGKDAGKTPVELKNIVTIAQNQTGTAVEIGKLPNPEDIEPTEDTPLERPEPGGEYHW